MLPIPKLGRDPTKTFPKPQILTPRRFVVPQNYVNSCSQSWRFSLPSTQPPRILQSESEGEEFLLFRRRNHLPDQCSTSVDDDSPHVIFRMTNPPKKIVSFGFLKRLNQHEMVVAAFLDTLARLPGVPVCTHLNCIAFFAGNFSPGKSFFL